MFLGFARCKGVVRDECLGFEGSMLGCVGVVVFGRGSFVFYFG